MSFWLPCEFHGFAVANTVTVIVTQPVTAFEGRWCKDGRVGGWVGK